MKVMHRYLVIICDVSTLYYVIILPGKQCNDSALLHMFNDPTNESCVNWNQYYTDCRPGDKNPFQGAISFDNIGLAWVAIFLVGFMSSISCRGGKLHM